MRYCACLFSLAATLLFLTTGGLAEDAENDVQDAAPQGKEDPYFAAIISGNWDQAIELMSKKLAENPQDAKSLGARGQAYSFKHDHVKALADFNEAIRLDAKCHWVFNLRGDVHAECKDFEKALTDYTSAIQLQPQSPFYWISRGSVFHSLKKYDKAIADFSAALDLTRGGVPFIEAWVLDKRAGALLANGQFDPAITDCCEVIRISPSVHAYQVRGAAYYGKGDYDNALQDYSSAIRLDPQDVWSLTKRGGAYAKKKDFERALAELATAIHLNPKDESLYRTRGFIYATKEDWEKAIADYSQALLLDPKNSDALRLRGDVYSNMGKLDTAISDFSAAIELDGKSALAYLGRAYALVEKHEFKQSLVDYREAIRLDPKWSVAHNNLAWHLATCSIAEFRDGKEAVKHARLAGELTKWDVIHLRTIAAAYAESGDFSQAVKWQKEWLAKSSPEDKGELELEQQRLKLYEQGKPLRISK